MMVAILQSPLSVHAATAKPGRALIETIKHDMTVNIVLIGFTSRYLDVDYLEWSLEPRILPLIQEYEIIYGSEFNVAYNLIVASSTFEGGLRNYLKSIASTQRVPAYLETVEDPNSYAVIDSSSTEDWLNTHSSDFGGIPSNGYTLLVANMSTVSELYHYYSTSYVDRDAYSPRATYYETGLSFPVIRWMYSWGGRYRFYYIDVSAGDPKYFYSQIEEHIPVQEFFKGWTKSTEALMGYLSQYIGEAVRNLFVPSYVYSPTYSTSYRVEVLLFDNTTRLTQADYTQVISSSLIKSALAELIPYASWEVKIGYVPLRSDPLLYMAVQHSIIGGAWETGRGGERVHYLYLDHEPIYSYLQAHLSKYVDTSGDVTVLPVFCFLFSSAGQFAGSWKEYAGTSIWDSGTMRRGFTGVSLGDLSLIGLGEREVFDWGNCFSQVVIHETGHAVGLMHPFSYGETEDYVSSAMAYKLYEYQFSQFDKDAIQRGHADQLIYKVREQLFGAQFVSYESPNATSSLSQAQTAYNSGLSAYSSRGYEEAISRFNAAYALVDKTFKAESSLIQDKIGALGKLECPQAQRLAQEATDELAEANKGYQGEDYGSAHLHLQAASLSVSQCKTTEQGYQQAKSVVDEAQLKINAVGALTSQEAILTLEQATDELAMAKESFEKGEFTDAYWRAQTSSIYAEDATTIEQVFQRQRLFSISIGLAIGGLLAAIAWLISLKKKGAPTIQPAEIPR